MRFLTFSKVEIKEIVKAWIAVSLVFAIAIVGLSGKLFLAIPIALITGGIAFLLHELAHKYVAQNYKCWAEFRANDQMLMIGLLLSIFGIIILAPGGVYVHGATRSQHGKIALAGPGMNIFLGLIFLGVMQTTTGFWNSVLGYGYQINAFLAVFNMIPFPPFDGISVWHWNKAVYLVAMTAAGALLAYSFM